MSTLGTELMIFAVVMACLAAAVVLVTAVAEMGEAWDIAHHGWDEGHRRHHPLRGHQTR